MKNRNQNAPEDAFGKALDGLLELLFRDAPTQVWAEVAEHVLHKARRIALPPQRRAHFLKHQETHAFFVERCVYRIHVQLHFQLLLRWLLRDWL